MQNLSFFPIMACLQRLQHLRQYNPYHIFRQVLLLLLGVLDQSGDIATFTVLHDNEDFGRISVNHPIIILDNVLVIELTQYIYFTNQHLLFFFAHFAIAQLLPNQDFAISSASNQGDFAKATFSNILYLFIFVHALRILSFGFWFLFRHDF